MSERFELAIQALLDGRPLPADTVPAPHDASSDPICVVDAIARAHRIVVLGRDAPLDAAAPNTWGHLERRAEIARGASGTVHRAWDPKLAREVALKLLTADAIGLDDALEEGRLLARLNHHHIVRVFGADTHDGIAGIWMELLDGETLDAIVARDGVFGVEETLLIGHDLAGALAAVHAAGLLHRDVKARNVIRARGGRVVLMDLGAGRPAESDAPRDETGTPMYMAPEVLAGGAATVRSDIYSLGVLLYRLLTRTYPVTAADLTQLRQAHADGLRARLGAMRPDVPAAVVNAIERACDADPGRRYASAVEFEAALFDALQRTTAAASAVSSPIQRRWHRWKRPLVRSAAAVALAVASIGMAWDSMPGRNARRAVGLAVPPRSVLYLTMNGGLGLVRGTTLSIYPHNPTTAGSIAVSSDLGVLTMAQNPPWTSGGAFTLDGAPAPAASAVNAGSCCWVDGTTDGAFNYAIRQDSTMLEPIGSRPLAPPAVYRFGRDWSNPEPLFALDPAGTYTGIAYEAASNSFWASRNGQDQTRIERWSRDGRLLATPVTLPGAILKSLAIDPRDDTLWTVREQIGQIGSLRLENFDRSGRHLGTVVLDTVHPLLGVSGADFAWDEGR